MVYPFFDISSITTRCTNDINKFIKKYNLEINTGISLIQPNIVDIKTNMQKIVDYLNETSRLNNEEYVKKIRNIDQQQQNECWIARTYLFYQLLILTTVLLSNKDEYNAMFAESSTRFPFREDIPGELKNFKMGIFGSITPSSDIDLGIQYSGTTLEIPGLAYIIHAFESLFVLLTGKKNGSLAYDIETYADMLTLTKDNIDYFYLDSSKFGEYQFREILPYIGNSIIRSLLLANNNIMPFSDFEPKLTELKTNPGLGISTFTSELNELNVNPGLTDNDLTTIIAIIKNRWDASNKTIHQFLNDPYETQRYTYYTKVLAAEKRKNELTHNSVDYISKLTVDDICGLMQLISESLTYRIESYICAPTVVHVVRILQASKGDSTKYPTNTPEEFCKNLQNVATVPLCTIGKYGFIISMLEQLGNIHRFKITYCDKDEIYKEKCTAKLDKYAIRYKDAIYWLGKYSQSNGGNPRKSRKNRKKSRKTKRRIKKRKYTR
jgi:hypothetical protein